MIPTHGNAGENPSVPRNQCPEVPSISLDTLSARDLLRPDLMADPYPIYRRLRREDPIHKDPNADLWFVTRYDDVAAILSDRRFSNVRAPIGVVEIADNPVPASIAKMLLFLDPPDHTRLRRLFAKAFAPNRMEQLRPGILALVSDLLDAAEAKDGWVDFMRDFAVPLPINVIGQILGIPEEDRPRLYGWTNDIGTLLGGQDLPKEELTAASVGVRAFMTFLEELIHTRRRKPARDMLSDMIETEEMGDRLTTQELISHIMLLIAAGNGTTTNTLGNGILALSRNPSQWRLLVDEPSIVPSAVNELLRYEASVQFSGRIALEDVAIGGKLIAKGQRAWTFFGAANRDEAHFQEPDTLDLRRPQGRLMTFGHGIHICLGAVLARMELQAAFGEVSRRFPRLEVAEESAERIRTLAFRGLERLDVRLRN